MVKKVHIGKNLHPVENPDEITVIPIDKRSLPKGRYRDVGYDARQVIDIRISRFVTEYRAQILEDPNGNSFVAPFPLHVTRPVQYGQDLKAHSVYLSESNCRQGFPTSFHLSQKILRVDC